MASFLVLTTTCLTNRKFTGGILLFDDGIQVKGQKAERQEAKDENKSQKYIGDKLMCIQVALNWC
jgi:hypothetical protein